jgi:hypothetical protein
MPKALKLRPLTTEEEAEIRRLTASRKAAHRLVQQAKVIVAILDDRNSTQHRQEPKQVSLVDNPG